MSVANEECANGIQPYNHTIGSWNDPTENTITLSASRGRQETCDENHSHHCAVIVALSVASAAYAKETLKGEVVTLDKASKKIGIKLSGTVGSSDTTAPTPFKVQDTRRFNVVKPGDKVSFTAEREDGVMTIKEITKE